MGSKLQKQPSRTFLQKTCFENMQQMYRRTTMSKCESPETMRKPCLSTKFPHQEIRLIYGILRSRHNVTLQQVRLLKAWCFNSGSIRVSFGTKYLRMDQVKLSTPYPFKIFKGCLSQILLGSSWILCPILKFIEPVCKAIYNSIFENANRKVTDQNTTTT